MNNVKTWRSEDGETLHTIYDEDLELQREASYDEYIESVIDEQASKVTRPPLTIEQQQEILRILEVDASHVSWDTVEAHGGFGVDEYVISWIQVHAPSQFTQAQREAIKAVVGNV